MIRLKWQYLLLIIFLCIIWGSISFNRPLFSEKIERQAYDRHLFSIEFPYCEPEIVLVLAGEETLSRFGKWPWPRRYHAKLLGKLGYAKTILLDILFPENSIQEDDFALAEVVKKLGNVALAMHLTPGTEGKALEIVTPFIELLEAGAGAGFINVETDVDGIIRFVSPVREASGRIMPSFALAAIPLVTKEIPQLKEQRNNEFILSIGSRKLPVDSNGRLWIQFSKKPYKTYEYYKVLSGDVSPDVFKGKIVIVGIAASGVEDFYLTPFPGGNRIVTGTQLNAEIIRNFLVGKTPKRVTPYTDGLITVVLVLFGAVSAIMARPFWSIISAACICIVFILINWIIFSKLLIWAAIVVPLLGLLSAYFIVLFVRFKFLHTDWEIKTYSISSLYNLSDKSDKQFESFAEYIDSVWPDIEKNTGVKLFSSCMTEKDLKNEKGLELEKIRKADEGKVIVFENYKEKLRFRMLIPVTADQLDGKKKYMLLGWKQKLTDELIQTLCTMVLSASWFFGFLSESRERKKVLMDTIYAIFTAVDVRDPITGGHSTRVSDITLEILQHMGLGTKMVENIHLGALIHDIGKIGIPDSVLAKPGKLTQEEFALIREHPNIGKKIMSSVRLPEDTLKVLQEHHERIDGKGYPYRLKGDEISLAGKIVAVADVFDALTSERPYRKAMSIHEICNYLNERKGTEFDPEVVNAILELRAPQDWLPNQDSKE